MDRTERDITFAQAEADYGTSDLRELNRLLANRAANATDGNGVRGDRICNALIVRSNAFPSFTASKMDGKLTFTIVLSRPVKHRAN